MKKSTSLLIQDKSGNYLLLQRSKASKAFSGWWESPGGKIDDGESAAEAVVREVREEAGIVAPPPDPASGVVIGVPDGSVQYTFFAWECDTRPEVVLSDEHSDSQWVSFTAARKLETLMRPHREFLERRWHQRQITVYAAQQERYKTFAAVLGKVLDRLRDRWAPLAIVQARAKTLSSFAEKCLRKADKYDDPVSQLTDLCGGRMICTTTDEAATVCRQLRVLFAPLDEDDNTATRHKIDAFGYLSVHFIVHFQPGVAEMLDVPVPPEIVGLKGEIQVRSLLQHAHSEVTHDRLYKSGFNPPEQCRREAAMVAAVLESTDDQFARFVRQLDGYIGHYAAHLTPAQRLREIADLRLVLSHERQAERRAPIALRLARLYRAGWDWQGVVAALEPLAAGGGTQNSWVSVELGNACCRLHRETPENPSFKRGLRLLESVARPDEEPVAAQEADERARRATALAWLGSARSKQAGRRAEARNCLAKAVELAPDDPYHLTAFVELDVVASGTCSHIDLLAPSLRQAAGRCAEHIRAGIEVTRAWLTLCKIRLLLNDGAGALEALCLAARAAETRHPLVDLQRSLDGLADAIGSCRPFVSVLNQAALVLIALKTDKGQRAVFAPALDPAKPGYAFHADRPVLILAGSTDSQSGSRLAVYEEPLRDALSNYSGYLITGGSAAGVCALAARCAAQANASGGARIELVGYLPAKADAAPDFPAIVRTRGADFSLLEPLQTWGDLLDAGVAPASVTLLCLGGGEISAQELALAWAAGARVAAVAGEAVAPARFAALLAACGRDSGRGMILPDDAATLRAFIPFDRPVDDAKWDAPGRIIHENYVKSVRGKASQPNLLPWPLLRDDFKHSNRHQAACSAEILRQCGFDVRSAAPAQGASESIELTDDEIERLSEREHGRWNIERLSNGWRLADQKNEALKLSPYLVPWCKLPDAIREYDRQAVRNWPAILVQAGLEISRMPA